MKIIVMLLPLSLMASSCSIYHIQTPPVAIGGNVTININGSKEVSGKMANEISPAGNTVSPSGNTLPLVP